MNSLEKVQYQSALAVTGTWQGTSLNKLYDELGWESLTDRRWSRRLIQFYKIQNNYTPIYLKLNLTQLDVGIVSIPIVLKPGTILAPNFEILHLLSYLRQIFLNLFSPQENSCLAFMTQVE